MQAGASSADETNPADSGVILLAGATGYLGKHVARTLVRRGYRVLAPVRDSSSNRPVLAGVDYRETRLDDPRALLDDLGTDRIDAVISCLASRSGSREDAWRVDHAMNRNLLSVARALHARRFVLLSAICVQKPRLAFQQAKLAFEGELAESGMPFVIVRPTAFFKSLSGQLERVRRGKPFLLFGAGTLTRCKPISEADLARFLVDCLDCPDRRDRIVPIGGPGPAVSPRQQGEWLFEALGKEPRFRSISPDWFHKGAWVLDVASRIFPRFKDTAEFARIAHYYATESMLAWNPDTGEYEAGATPEFGTETLRDHYRRLVEGDGGDQALGEHQLFR
jgi:divinyl chlorophyllide a 8-vinyl-reductase